MAENSTASGWKSKVGQWQWLLFLLLMGAALVVVCPEMLKPGYVSWSNDTSLGAYKTASANLPDVYTGHWIDGNWIGIEDPANAPTVSAILEQLTSPVLFEKIFPPFTMWLLGFSAWLLFRQLKFAPAVCIIGGLAAGLNMHCFSNATWGLGNWNVAISMIFFTFSVLITDSIRARWSKAVFAGLAVGMAVMEAFDSGAILSVYAGVFILFYCWITAPSLGARISGSLATIIAVVIFAVLIAASTISTLVNTSVRGIQGMGQTAAEKAQRWEGATIWSLPKIETLRIFIPGLYGYRLDNYDTTADKAGVYWGRVGEDPRLTALSSSDAKTRVEMAKSLATYAPGIPPEELKILEGDDVDARAVVVEQVSGRYGLQRRHTGSGEFSGLLVTLLALFGLANSWRRQQMPYSRNERLIVWFWGLAALFSLMAAWGRFSFLYAVLYKIPYFSTIRNPIKFLHPFNLSLIILAGFGLEALARNYLKAAAPAPESAAKPAKSEPSRSPKAEPPKPAKIEASELALFDKAWISGLAGAVIVTGLFYWIYVGSHSTTAKHVFQNLTQYVAHQGFAEDASAPPPHAGDIAAFCLTEIGWFVLFLGLSAGTIACVLTGVLGGRKAVAAWLALGAIMACDLGRADRPWVRYYNYQEKYSMNPIVDILRHEPWEHRVAAKLAPNDFSYSLCFGEYGILGNICHWWLENDFPYNNIEAVDFDQLSRPPLMELNYLGAFSPRSEATGGQVNPAAPVRLWKLCNAGYLLCPADVVPVLNERADPGRRGFQIRARFDLEPKPWVTQPEDAGDYIAVTNASGKFALVELTDALPRAKLYANWQIPADDASTLQLLASDIFDMDKNVLVASNTPVPPPATPEADPGTVQITEYKPKEVHLHATNPKTPAVLLLNDHTSENWHAWVDQKPVQPLRCNYIMRGVYLTPGDHTVDFRYQPPLGSFYVTLAAMAVGFLLALWTIYIHFSPVVRTPK
jgi:hypothetical protein